MNTLSSMIDVRIEAMRIAIQLKDITAENIVMVAKEIEEYIISEAELPEVGTDYCKSLFERFSANIGGQPQGNLAAESKSATPNEETLA